MTLIKPASTVLVVREVADQVEVLLLKRSSQLAFAPNNWVFPGGRIDPSDGPLAPEHIEATAKIAAVREAHEEAQLIIQPQTLTHFCHWTTPTGGSRRFSTWFFHCKLSKGHSPVQVDNSEIIDAQWITPTEALQAMNKKQLFLLPPTFLNLARIANAKNYNDVKLEYDRTGIIKAEPVTTRKDGVFYSLYKGDAGYESEDITSTASLHRLIINPQSGDYQFLHKNCSVQPVDGGLSQQ